MEVRKQPWPAWHQIGPVLFFDHDGCGPAVPTIEVRLNLSLIGEERVGVFMDGIGGPFLTPDDADALAAALSQASMAARLLSENKMSTFEALAAADALLSVSNIDAFPET